MSLLHKHFVLLQQFNCLITNLESWSIITHPFYDKKKVAFEWLKGVKYCELQGPKAKIWWPTTPPPSTHTHWWLLYELWVMMPWSHRFLLGITNCYYIVQGIRVVKCIHSYSCILMGSPASTGPRCSFCGGFGYSYTTELLLWTLINSKYTLDSTNTYIKQFVTQTFCVSICRQMSPWEQWCSSLATWTNWGYFLSLWDMELAWWNFNPRSHYKGTDWGGARMISWAIFIHLYGWIQ